MLHAKPIGDLIVNVKFHDFPHACYICKGVDHFARNCPHKNKVGETSPQQQKERATAVDKAATKDAAEAFMFEARKPLEPEKDKEGFTRVTSHKARGRGAWRRSAEDRSTTLRNFFGRLTNEGGQAAPDLDLMKGSGLEDTVEHLMEEGETICGGAVEKAVVVNHVEHRMESGESSGGGYLESRREKPAAHNVVEDGTLHARSVEK